MIPYTVNKKFKLYTDVLYFLLGVGTDCDSNGVAYLDNVYFRPGTNDYKVVIKMY